MSVPVEFFFDLSSPWTRLAFHNLRTWAADRDVEVRWRPFLVGGVFNAVNDSVYAGRQRPDDPKVRLNFVWLKEWANLAGVAMNFPSSHHPLRSVLAMRMCCAIEDQQDRIVTFAEAAFEAYFSDQRNLDDPTVISAVASSCGFDGAALLEAAQSPEVKERLRLNTQEAIDRGSFGSPTIFVDRKYMYFGNDQLPLVQRRIQSCHQA